MLKTKKIINTALLILLLFNFNITSYADVITLSNAEKLKVINLENGINQEINPLATKNQVDKKDPLLAGLYSAILPGAGMIYLGEKNKGLLYSSLLIPIVGQNYITTDNYYSKSAKVQLYSTAVDLYFYNVYDTYQTALDKLDRPKRVLNMKHYSLPDLYLSLFNPKSYVSKNIWTNIAIYTHLALLAISLAIGATQINKNVNAGKLLLVIPLSFIVSSFVSVGEESYFRGFIQPAASELTGSKILGNLAQATYFGAVHTHFFADKYGTTFPHGIGTIASLTNTIDKKREFKEPLSNSLGSNTNDLNYFLSAGAFGLILGGINLNEEDDGLLISTAMHTIHDASLITLGYINEGNTGRVYLPVMSAKF